MTIWIQTTLKTGQMQYTPVEEFYLIWLTHYIRHGINLSLLMGKQ